MEAIIKELSKYFDRLTMETLRNHLATKGSITIVLFLSQVITKYNSTEENEIKVEKLLSSLLALHFGSVQLTELTKDNVPFLEVIAISNTGKALFGYISQLGNDPNKFICRNYNETLIMVTHFIDLQKK